MRRGVASIAVVGIARGRYSRLEHWAELKLKLKHRLKHRLRLEGWAQAQAQAGGSG